MKLWIDECLSPTLVEQAAGRGYWATCNRDRGLLGALDAHLHRTVVDEEAVFFTNDESDFEALCRKVDLHSGLVILPQTGTRKEQWPLLDAALIYIERQSKAAGEPAADWMINKRVEVAPDGTVAHEVLPDGV